MTYKTLCHVMLQEPCSIPGIAKCGDPPEIASPGILVVNNMEAVYSCPEDLRLYGIEKRTCHVEDQAWKPAKDQASKCLAN